MTPSISKESQSPLWKVMISGGIGGMTGDFLMHSIDTVKTRQQAAVNVLKYLSMSTAYRTIYLEEGVLRGLYSGITPALAGSLPGTILFFGTYEFSKRELLEIGCPETPSHLISGLVGDLFASVIYVPSEVLKTRLQLQGRYMNPYFHSGYNYRSTWDAFRMIRKNEGTKALFHGYKATLSRDLPFSALQFAFYEQFRVWGQCFSGNTNIGMKLDFLAGGMAGAFAGFLTTPLDVVKTRLQTQKPFPVSRKVGLQRNIGLAPVSTSQTNLTRLSTQKVFIGLETIYRNEGWLGLFRGVGPRTAWTCAQSGFMFVVYQSVLRFLNYTGL